MDDFNDEDIIMPDEEVDTPATTEEGENVAKQTSEATQVDNEEQKVLDYLNKRGIRGLEDSFWLSLRYSHNLLPTL